MGTEPPIVGRHADYDWLTTDCELEVLLHLCPEVVLGKYVAITSLDSGPVDPDDELKSAGWESRKGIAYSPPVQDIERLTLGGCDEWYVFDAPADLGRALSGNVFTTSIEPGQVAVFVNYCGFALHDPSMQDLIALFWKQIDWVQPRCFIADGDVCLNFATRDKELFSRVHRALVDRP